MTAELHGRVRALFAEALELPESDRLGFLHSACSSEPEALPIVLELLEAHRGCESFLEGGARPTRRIGRYLVTGELGRGAMGIVYEAIDPLIGRKVAVKVIRLQALADAGEPQLPERLLREARSAGVLSHPGIVIIFDVGQEGDLAFIAMELVEGISLYQVLASRQRLPPADALAILRQAAAALDYAHRNGVLHRDVKPANIMIDKAGRAKIADFGIAKITSAEISTMTGKVIGTPVYMSPEQIRALPSDGRSDQFSLAVVAFELLTGCRPFHGDTLAMLIHMIVYADRPSARVRNRALTPAVDDVLHRGLARRPADRYPSCTEFVAALEAASKDLAKPRPNEDAPAWTKTPALLDGPVKPWYVVRRPWRPKAAGALLALLIAFVLYYGFSHNFQPADSQSSDEPTVPALPKPMVHPRPKAAAAKPAQGYNPNVASAGDATRQTPAPPEPGTASPEIVHQADNGVSPAVLIGRVFPVPSEVAQKLRAKGVAWLSLVVQPDGTTRDVKVVRSMGYGLDEASVESARHWRYRPAMKDGKAVSYPVVVEIPLPAIHDQPGTWHSGPMPFFSDADVAPPVVTDGTMPDSAGETSDEAVVIEFTVGASGSVIKAHATHGSQPSSKLLTDSLRTWTFRPAMKGNRPVEAAGRVLFTKGKGDQAANLPLWQSSPQSNPPELPVEASSEGVFLKPLDPAALDHTTRAIDYTTQALIDFVNRTSGAVDIYRMDYKGERWSVQGGLAAGDHWLVRTFLTVQFLVVASGTGGNTAHDTGVRLAGFEAVTPNSGSDPKKRDIAIISGH